MPSYLLGLSLLHRTPALGTRWDIFALVSDVRPSVAAAFALPPSARRRLEQLACLGCGDADALTFEWRRERWVRSGSPAPSAQACFSTGRQTRWCPMCVGEMPLQDAFPCQRTAHMIWWSAYGAAVCPLHKLWLAERCLVCGAIPTIASVVEGACSCGWSLADSVGQPASGDLLIAQSALYSALEEGSSDLVPGGLELGAYLLLYRLVRPVLVSAFRAGWAPRSGDAIPPGCASRSGGTLPSDRGSLQEDAAATLLIHAALADLPDSWAQFLETCRGLPSRFSRRFKHGTEHDFGLLLARLRRLQDPVFTPVLMATERYLRSEWDGGVIRAAPFASLRTNDISPTVVGLNRTSKELRVCAATVRALVSRGELKGRLYRSGSRWSAAIDPKSLKRLANKRSCSSLRADDVARILGVGRRTVHAFVREGLLESLQIGGYRPHRPFDRRSVEAFRARIASVLTAPPEPAQATVVWDDIRRRTGQPTARVVREILRGGYTGCTGPSLRDVRLTPASANRLAATLRERRQWLSVADAARLLGFSHGVVRSMAREGFLPSVNRNQRLIFERAEIEGFHQQYVTVREWVERTGIPRHTIKSWIAASGIHPAWSGGGRRRLFARSDLEAEMAWRLERRRHRQH